MDHLKMNEQEGDCTAGEDDDDPAVEDGNVLNDGQVRQLSAYGLSL